MNIKKIFILKIISFFLFLPYISQGQTGTIVSSGLINVLPYGATDKKGRLIQAGLSAAVYNGDGVIVANDRDIPGDDKSSVFLIGNNIIEEMIDNRLHDALIDRDELVFFDQWFIQNASKYESASRSADGSQIFLATALNSVEGDTSRSKYNCFLQWKLGLPNNVHLAYPTVQNFNLCSDELRRKISQALATEEFPGGVPWFNMEGMTTIGHNQIIFGIRQLGESYLNYKYCLKLLLGSYEITKHGIVLKDDLKIVYDKDPQSFPEIKRELSVSSLEYDSRNDIIYILTSYEEGDYAEDIGSYLWFIRRGELESNSPPSPILNEQGNPIHFDSKMEGLTILPDNHLFLVADDDTALDAGFIREQNQAGFMILKINFNENRPIYSY